MQGNPYSCSTLCYGRRETPLHGEMSHMCMLHKPWRECICVYHSDLSQGDPSQTTARRSGNASASRWCSLWSMCLRGPQLLRLAVCPTGTSMTALPSFPETIIAGEMRVQRPGVCIQMHRPDPAAGPPPPHGHTPLAGISGDRTCVSSQV